MKKSVIAAGLAALASGALAPVAQPDTGVTLTVNGKSVLPPNYTPDVGCNMGRTQATRLNVQIMVSGPTSASGVAEIDGNNQVVWVSLGDYGANSVNKAQHQGGPFTGGDDATVTNNGLSYKIVGHASRMVQNAGPDMAPTGSPLPFEFAATCPHALTPMSAQ